MQRFASFLAALSLVLVAAAPALAATGRLTNTDRTIISISGDVTLPAGEEAQLVLVIKGNALIQGTAETVVVITGTATLTGARVQSLAVVDGTATVGAGSTVYGDVAELNGRIDRAQGGTVNGVVRSLATELAGLGLFLGLAAIVLWIGVAIALFVAALALAALAARQVRTAEAIISTEPWKAFGIGIVMLVLPPIVVALLAATLVGLPLALALLLMVWPAMAFIGYLVAAIWIGEWVLRRSGRTVVAERPYLAAVVGVLIAGVLGVIPVVSAVISIVGLGAVTIAAWRVFSGARPAMQPAQAPVVPAAG